MLNFLNGLFFVSLNKVFRNFASGGRERVCVCFVRAKDRIRCYLKLRAVKFCFAKSYEVVYSPSLVKRDRTEHFCYLLRCSEAREGTWDSIIAVIGDGTKSELAGVRKVSLLPL